MAMRFFFIVSGLIFLNVQGQSPGITKSFIANDELPACNLIIEPYADQKKWISYLEENLELDSAALDSIPPGRYTLLVQFAIVANGSLEDIKIMNDPGYGLAQRVINVFSGCKGIWKPAFNMYKDSVVTSYLRQAITFLIEKAGCENDLPGDLRL